MMPMRVSRSSLATLDWRIQLPCVFFGIMLRLKMLYKRRFSTSFGTQSILIHPKGPPRIGLHKSLTIKLSTGGRTSNEDTSSVVQKSVVLRKLLQGVRISIVNSGQS